MQPNPVIRLEGNARDDLTHVTDPRSRATAYTDNRFGEAPTQVSSDTGSTIRTFEATGNLKTSRDARNKTSYTYDATNRLTQAKYGDNTVCNYTYDESVNGIGRLTRMVDPGPITTVWTYTPPGRVATRTPTIGTGTCTHALGYRYNPSTGQLPRSPARAAASSPMSTTPPKDLESVRLDGLPVASSIVWHPRGDVKRMTLG